jgi:sugar phosphate permease
MISAVFLMFYSVFIIPILKKYLGTYKLFVIMQILNPIAVFSTSLLSYSNNIDNVSLSILSCFFFILKGSFATSSVVLVNLMINNSTEKKYLGRVNGISQSFAAFGSIFGPVLGGLLYAWSISNNRNFPLDIHFSFGTFALISSINLLAVNFIDETIGERKE